MDEAQAVVERNLVLTGFMGTGKTTIGRMVASELGWSFVDSDALIVKRFGPVEEIFDSHGEDHFRELERKVASELAQGTRQVIATGGALILDDQSAAVLNATGRTFCLVARPETIFKRLGEGAGKKRPMLAGDNPEGRIRDLLAERSQGYGAFPQFSTETSTMENIASGLADLVATEPEHLVGPNGGSWWIGAGIMGSAAQLSGHVGPVVAVVDFESRRYGPATGAWEIIEIGGVRPLVQLRRQLGEIGDAAPIVVAVGGEQLMSLVVMACEAAQLRVVLCPTGAAAVNDAVDIGAAVAPGHPVVLELGTLQSGDPEYVEPLQELWASVATRLTDYP
jgi:shikimate kinase